MSKEKEMVPQSEDAPPGDQTNGLELPGSHTVFIDGVEYAPIDGQNGPPPYESIGGELPSGPITTQPTNSRL